MYYIYKKATEDFRARIGSKVELELSSQIIYNPITKNTTICTHVLKLVITVQDIYVVINVLIDTLTTIPDDF